MSGEVPSPDEPGLALERTALAWVRASLGVIVVALLLVRLGVAAGRPSGELAGWCALLLAVGLGLRQRFQVGARSARMRSGGGVVQTGPVVLATVLTVLLAGVALGVVLTG